MSSAMDYPFAVKVATGRVCALTGDRWAEHLNRDPGFPDQPWLEGCCVDEGVTQRMPSC